MIYLIGAGPGALDLITVRGAELLRHAGMILYAGPRVAELLGHAPWGCMVHDAAAMELDDVLEKLLLGYRLGAVTVSLWPGAPALRGAIVDLMDRLRALDVPFEIVPGVSAGEGSTVDAARAFDVSVRDRPPLFPMMIDLVGRPVLVVGGGVVAGRRAATLLRCGAAVRAVAPAFCPGSPDGVQRVLRPFEPSDLDGVALAVAATDVRDVNALVAREAKERGVPVSVADAPEEGTFSFPSLVASGPVAASVSSAGLSCSLTRRLSDRLRAVWQGWVAEERTAIDEEDARA